MTDQDRYLKKSKKNTLEECKNAILKVADVFRCNDIHLEGLANIPILGRVG